MHEERVIKGGDNLAVIMDEHGCTLSLVSIENRSKVVTNIRNVHSFGSSLECTRESFIQALTEAGILTTDGRVAESPA